MKNWRVLRLACLALPAVALMAQAPVFEKPSRSGERAEAVQYLFPEQVTVTAGKASPVALHFRVAPGLHINSHAPKDEFLIPTVFSIPESSGVRLEAADYPPGIDFVLPVEPKEKLNVYMLSSSIDPHDRERAMLPRSGAGPQPELS